MAAADNKYILGLCGIMKIFREHKRKDLHFPLKAVDNLCTFKSVYVPSVLFIDKSKLPFPYEIVLILSILFLFTSASRFIYSVVLCIIMLCH